MCAFLAAGAELPGRKPDGSTLLANQWSIRPAGAQVGVGDFPVNIAVHPSGAYAAVLDCGYGQHEIVVLRLPSGKLVSRTAVDVAFYGLQFSADGSELITSGADDEVVRAFAFADGRLTHGRELRMRDVSEVGLVSGVALSAGGSTAYAVELFAMDLVALNMRSGETLWRTPLIQAGDTVKLGREILPEDFDLAAGEKRAAAAKRMVSPGAPWPYGCIVDAARGRVYVSLWGRGEVAAVDTGSHAVVARWKTGEHPSEMVLDPAGRRLFVANGNENTVTVLDPETGRAVETLSVAFSPDEPPGATPNSLAVSPDGRRLFVANAGINAVAVFDVQKPGESRSMGFIPAGWYPTSVRVTPDGKNLLIANGRGVLPKANRHGPQPGLQEGREEYIGGIFEGTVGIVPLPAKDEELASKLSAWTAQARRGSPGTGVASARPKGSPVPARPGDPSPIEYVIYIIKENRTYDQVLGDLPGANGDPALCLFDESITPNHHRLAKEFVVLDNFYVDGEVSANGHEWSTAAFATDFVQKIWPLSYGHSSRGKTPYPAEGNFPIARPKNGYLWDRAAQAGVSYRSYGEFVVNGPKPDAPGYTRVAALEGHIDPLFRSFDLDYSDQKRADRFISELHRYEREGGMPRLQILRLPNDHTSGTAKGKLTPRAFLADNDLAFGRLVEAVSRSKFWPKTAIFVLEDDAQDGPDHIDAHRSIAYVISPYTAKGRRDSTMYSTSSMLRTMELILGLKPMSEFDAKAAPMFGAFQTKPDLKPYKASPVSVPLDEHNVASAWGAEASEAMDFTREDAAPEGVLNDIIWRSVKGAEHPMPAPVRSAFVVSRAPVGDGDDD
jgi:YVTN family beta-propeller protein